MAVKSVVRCCLATDFPNLLRAATIIASAANLSNQRKNEYNFAHKLTEMLRTLLQLDRPPFPSLAYAEGKEVRPRLFECSGRGNEMHWRITITPPM